ncbi:MAG: MarR family winged helix-turn-helix transcriptional regulator [Xanthobacteraceae bacterium]
MTTEIRETLARIPKVCLGYRVREAERVLSRYFNARFKAVGLTAVQFGILVGIESSEKPTIAELAAGSGADPSTLARNLQLLESGNFLSGEGGRGRSGKRFVLSPKGRRAIRAAVPVWEHAYAELVEKIGRKSARDGLKFLTALEAAANSVSDA